MNAPPGLLRREPSFPEVLEISLLLPTWQVAALESAGRARGLTAGQMVRSVLRDFLGRADDKEDAAPLW